MNCRESSPSHTSLSRSNVSQRAMTRAPQVVSQRLVALSDRAQQHQMKSLCRCAGSIVWDVMCKFDWNSEIELAEFGASHRRQGPLSHTAHTERRCVYTVRSYSSIYGSDRSRSLLTTHREHYEGSLKHSMVLHGTLGALKHFNSGVFSFWQENASKNKRGR